jgi:hypothetical protein
VDAVAASWIVGRFEKISSKQEMFALSAELGDSIL